ncbi:MAG: polyphosphate kinase 1, partial [Eggerthellaceae bacterium]|nr:polyphosphate kinase 1 [Eggerthellaceae bacterium]
NVIYGFHDYKVHSKICSIIRHTPQGVQYITQLGTGNYNEKTARLYTDFSFITTRPEIGKDAVEFFRNMNLENTSRAYRHLWVAPLQIKQNILVNIDKQIELAEAGEPCGLFFKTNSVTDKDVIEKIAEASRAGVPVTMLVRGISCIVPGVKHHTENVRVVSIVGRLLEHSRIFIFGAQDNCKVFLSSADLMTRNLDKRIEIAWPVEDETVKQQVLDYVNTCLSDTVKLRELKRDRKWTGLGMLTRGKNGLPARNAQEELIAEAAKRSRAAERAAKTTKKQTKK